MLTVEGEALKVRAQMLHNLLRDAEAEVENVRGGVWGPMRVGGTPGALVSLLLYVVKAVKAAGVPLNVEVVTGALIPLVLWGVWRTTRRIHEKLRARP